MVSSILSRISLIIASIVGTIGSVDDLIEKNSKKIELLEKQIMNRFGDFYSALSYNSTIGENFECVLGGTPNTEKDEYWGGNVNWINSGELNKIRIVAPSRTITRAGLEKSAAKMMPKGTTVLAITGATLGKTSLLEIDTSGNQSIIGILENEKFQKDFIYPMLITELPVLITHKTGGAQLHINKNDVLGLKIKVPTVMQYKRYSEHVMPLFGLQSNLVWQNEKLKKLKAQLLTKYF